MIYLTTGTPGSYKTLSTLMFVEKFRQNELKEGRERNVYYFGINELKLDAWLPFDEPKKWYELPDNSIIVIDECQKEECGFGAKSHLKAQEKTITELETHRHHGFDLFLITQGPHLINSRIKPLTNVHRHLRRVNGWNKALLYTSDGIIANPENKRNLNDIEKKWFKPDKKFYDFYQSATMHTVKKRIPKLYVYLFLIFLVFCYFGYRSYMMLNSKVSGEQEKIILKNDLITDYPMLENYDNSSKKKENFNPIIGYKPRIDNMPETAPAYDELRKPKTYPKANCLMTVDRCLCYTQQATLMKDYPDELCRDYVINGRFEPTKEDIVMRSGNILAKSDRDSERLRKNIEATNNNSQFYYPEYNKPESNHFTTHWEREIEDNVK